MAGRTQSSQPAPFEFVIFEGDGDDMRTVITTPNESSSWIDPKSLQLRHRIGRGPLGDVWLATHHRSAEDYDEHHEVAIKLLNLVKEDNIKIILEKLSDLYSKCQGLEGVCWLHGISVINGKVSLIMKFYEGSVGDIMAQRKGGKLPLADVLRYGMNLAQAIKELHSKEILVLNLKPSNFLIDANSQAILGDVGVTYLLLGISLTSSDTTHRLGTPNYMAPEQWEPGVRGPISFEADSWGFGCSILEMLTGVQPWSGKSAQQIYQSVVLNQEKPGIPSGLPSAIENLLFGCFEYDFRYRPLFSDILQAFESSHDEVIREGTNSEVGSSIITGKQTQLGQTEWFLCKDHLQEGDIVRSRKPPNSRKSETMIIPEGKVVGLEATDNPNGYVLVRVPRIHDPIRVHSSTLERVTHGFASGDWVRLKEDQKKHSPVGILHSIDRDGNVAVGFIGLEMLWRGKFSQLQMAEPYHVGQFVRLKTNIFSPRFEWPQKRQAWATGKIFQVNPNGCLVVKFPGRFPFGEKQGSFLADPAEVESVSFNTCPGFVGMYQHLEDLHWAVRPILVTIGLFTALKLGIFVGKCVIRPRTKDKGLNKQRDGQNADGTSNSAWLPSSVATIIFREGSTANASR